ncbi:unnamed protein product [Discula destructiva]
MNDHPLPPPQQGVKTGTAGSQEALLADTVAVAIASPVEPNSVHEHRVSHTPSKLPGLRFVDRGLRQLSEEQRPQQAQNPNSPRSVPQSVLVPPSAAGATGATGSTTTVGMSTVRAENRTTTAVSGSPPDRPELKRSAPASTPPSASGTAHASGLPSLLHPVTELDEAHSQPVDNVIVARPQQHTDTTSNAKPAKPSVQFTALPDDDDDHHHHHNLEPHQKQTALASAAPTTATPTAANVRPSATSSSSPFAHRSETGTDSSHHYTSATRPQARRYSSWNYSPLVTRPPARRKASWDPSLASQHASRSPATATNDGACGRRASSLPNATNVTLPDEHNKSLLRRTSSASRPPISNRPLHPRPTPGRIPPIRALRSSGSRESYLRDMNTSPPQYYDDGDDYQDYDSRNRSMRALEGRLPNGRARDAAHRNMDPDYDVAESENNTADIFMTIAREDSSSSIPRRSLDRRNDDEQSTASRVVRTTRTQRPRPQSIHTGVTQKPPSPPPVSRRLSDQQIQTSRSARRPPEDPPEQQTNRDAVHQNSAIGRPSLKLDSSRGSVGTVALRPSPITPRTQSVLDGPAERNHVFSRRPFTRTGDGRARSSSIKQPTGLSKSFNSSPLVPKNGSSHPTPNGPHVETSESSNSTAAPSTVWDELDELKSRIHRLELTGKLPKTSSAAISRTPDERPPTAGTGATTLSGSPKRAQTEIVSLASSQRETQSNLRSILSKTRPFVSSDVYDAIEAAANDALSLSQLMGTAGQAGPISSGASTIGFGGPSTVTDRQLRKKADSICRSLTELCIALKEEEPDRKPLATSRPQTRGTSQSRKDEAPRSPPMRVFNGSGPDEPLTSIEGYNGSRVTRLDKRATFNFTAMDGMSNGMANEPTPRYASSVIGGGDDNTVTGRQSSLVLARARRGVTEEPDDQGRKTSLLRTRRTASEEPEEQEGSRRSSVMYAPRRVTTVGRVSNIDEEPQMQSRAPSRAYTEVSNVRTEVGNGLRINVPTRDSIQRRPMLQEPASASAALPRTRLTTSGLPTPGPYSSRLMTPMTPTTPSGRRFLQINRQQAQEDNNTSNITGRLAEERGQRYSIPGPQSTVLTRASSLHRKRHSGIPSISGAASNVGGYR